MSNFKEHFKKADAEYKLICDDIFNQTVLKVKRIDKLVNDAISFIKKGNKVTKELNVKIRAVDFKD